jgi:hypothetical protein
MTTAPIARFVYGTRTLNINDNVRYALETGFAPPPALLSAQMSDGTSANRTGGATKIGQRAQNRQWSFSVQVLGISERDVSRAFQDLAAFMMYAGIDKANPLYFEYKPNSDINVQPVWGQDGWLRYEVRHANPPQIGDRYSSGEFRARNVTALLSIEVAPYAEGLQQRLCSAMGGIIEDTIGTVDGISRGLIVPEATCNLFTNPVFGNATWNTGWSAGASILALQNTDAAFLLPGTQNSARLTASASVTNTYTQDLTLSASQNAIWSVVKLPDGGTVASGNMQMCYNGSVLDTQYTNAGNGLWYAVASALGTASAASTGVVVKNGQTIYLLAAQAEQKTYKTPLCWGDLLGCSWTGTAHASTSTRTAGVVKLTTISGVAPTPPITVRVAVKTAEIPAAHNTNLFDLHDGTASGPWALIISGESRVTVVYNGRGAVSQDLTANTWYIFHLVILGTGEMTLYCNATASASTAAGLAAFGTDLFIGSSYAGTGHNNSTIGDVEIFAAALTATQIADDYANLSQVLADDRRISPVPWLWTLGGDDVLSLESGRQPLGVVCGVPGSEPAKTDIQGQLVQRWYDLKSILVGNFPASSYIPISCFLSDQSGNASASDYGGEHRVTILNSASPITLTIDNTIPARFAKHFWGNEVVEFARVLGASASAIGLVGGYYGTKANNLLYANSRPVTLNTAYRLFRTNSLMLYAEFVAKSITDGLELGVYGTIPTGAVNVSVDYFCVVPRPLAIISGTDTEYGFSISEKSYALSGSIVCSPLSVIGDKIEFVPDRVNHFQSYLCPDGTVNPLIEYYVTFSPIYVTPRWGLI